MKNPVLLAALLGGAIFFTSSVILAQPTDTAKPTPTPASQNANPNQNAKKQAITTNQNATPMQKIPGYDQLAPDKKAILDKMMADYSIDMRAKVSMLQAKYAMLQAKLYQQTVDKTEVNELVKDISDLQNQILQKRVDAILRIKDATGVALPLFPKTLIMYKKMPMHMHAHAHKKSKRK